MRTRARRRRWAWSRPAATMPRQSGPTLSARAQIPGRSGAVLPRRGGARDGCRQLPVDSRRRTPDAQPGQHVPAWRDPGFAAHPRARSGLSRCRSACSTSMEMLEWVKSGEAALSGTAAVLAGVGTLIYRGSEHRVATARWARSHAPCARNWSRFSRAKRPTGTAGSSAFERRHRPLSILRGLRRLPHPNRRRHHPHRRPNLRRRLRPPRRLFRPWIPTSPRAPR